MLGRELTTRPTLSKEKLKSFTKHFVRADTRSGVQAGLCMTGWMILSSHLVLKLIVFTHRRVESTFSYKMGLHHASVSDLMVPSAFLLVLNKFKESKCSQVVFHYQTFANLPKNWYQESYREKSTVSYFFKSITSYLFKITITFNLNQ